MPQKDLDAAEEILGEILNITLDVDDERLTALAGVGMIRGLIEDYIEEEE